ncbi:hypothetical protein [Formosa algae]|uniref:hypothetical protein n=1 Tax=Formosa algae TaxID=225843 RepID=UPI000CCE0E36|nr:hypothetical protein [Formosa algae]PNW27213.1 hypothetical protein BKP44_14060 [Formosa algae]
MDENTNNDIFVILQKVLDKLKNISENTQNNNVKTNEIHTRNNEGVSEVLSRVVKNLMLTDRLIESSRNKIIETVEENKTTPNVNNYKEYSLFGSKSHFKPLTLIIILYSLVIIWSAFKYLPPYLTEISTLKKEREEYKFFYDFMYLNQFKENGKTTANDVLTKYRQKDALLKNEFNSLLNTYNKEIRRQELEEELKSLENDGR